MEDREGLKAAYALDNGVYTAGDTLYVAGTKSFRCLGRPQDPLRADEPLAEVRGRLEGSESRKQCLRLSASLDTRSGERWLSSFSKGIQGSSR